MKKEILLELLSQVSVLIVIIGTFPGYIFRFQPKTCDGFDDMTQKCMIFKDGAVVTIGRYQSKNMLNKIKKNDFNDLKSVEK